MKTVVVDASMLVKRVLAEPNSGAVQVWFDEHSDVRLEGPTLPFSETERTLQKGSRRLSSSRNR